MVKKNNYKIWKNAKKIIPGGNMLISKRPPKFLEKKYPIYFKKCKDSFIWDINNKKYLDMYLMGVGTNILSLDFCDAFVLEYPPWRGKRFRPVQDIVSNINSKSINRPWINNEYFFHDCV